MQREAGRLPPGQRFSCFSLTAATGWRGSANFAAAIPQRRVNLESQIDPDAAGEKNNGRMKTPRGWQKRNELPEKACGGLSQPLPDDTRTRYDVPNLVPAQALCRPFVRGLQAARPLGTLGLALLGPLGRAPRTASVGAEERQQGSQGPQGSVGPRIRLAVGE